MSDVINKFLAIFLIVLMLLISPLAVMRQADRTQNKIAALNAMELFLDTCADAHQIDRGTYERLTASLEADGITAHTQICVYKVVISEGHTYLWKTALITDVSSVYELELGDIISLEVTEQTNARAGDVWLSFFGSNASTFHEKFMRMIK